MSHALEMRVRRHLAKTGERLVKIRFNSRDYAQYGPYMIVDDSNCVTASGIEDLESLLQS